MRNTLPPWLQRLFRFPAENRLQRSFGYSRTGKMVDLGDGSPPAALCHETRAKRIMKKKAITNSSSQVYLRASNWSIIPSPLSTATSATSLTHRKYGGWEPPMCREPKSGALYSTDFPRTRFPRNARVGAKKNFILNTFSPFSPPFRIRESAVSALRTIRQQFLIFPLLGQQIDPSWKFRRFNPV